MKNLEALDIEKNFALILTATINVDNIPRVYPADKSVREDQYIKTLTYYLQNHPKVKKIIFIENSASSLERLKQAAQQNSYQKEIEFISIDTNLSHGHRGKGFGECLLVQQGLKQSELITKVTHFGKITGRICLVNLTQLLETIPSNFDCVCDYKDLGYKIKKILLKKKVKNFVIPGSLFLVKIFIILIWKVYIRILIKSSLKSIFVLKLNTIKNYIPFHSR